MSCACNAQPGGFRQPAGRCAVCDPENDDACQRRLQRQAGVSASLFTKTLAAVTVRGPSVAAGKPQYWHQASDRPEAHRGGVDVKHGSYERYLAKRTGQLYKTGRTRAPAALRGNKRRPVGLAQLGGAGACT